MITLPLFYDIPYAQISMLMIIQAAEIIRFAIVRPYSTTWRNFTRFILELVLLVFFTTVLAQSYLVTMITLNDPNTLSLSISLFYAVGWVGFVLVFIFNIGFFVLLIINFIIGCKYSNRKLMSDARKKYYFEKVSNYEKEFEEVPLPLMNRWVKLGNLNAREEEKLPDINVRIECYRIQKQGSYFDI